MSNGLVAFGSINIVKFNAPFISVQLVYRGMIVPVAVVGTK